MVNTVTQVLYENQQGIYHVKIIYRVVAKTLPVSVLGLTISVPLIWP